MHMLRWSAVIMSMLGLASMAAAARADVLVIVDKASQRMSVAIDGRPTYLWPVSTGRRDHGTPTGVFQPLWIARSYFSKQYYDAPMPHAIFFYEGFAIHGTDDLGRLGGPAAQGCIRLHPPDAATLFALVEEQGRRGTRIIVTDSTALSAPASAREEEADTLRLPPIVSRPVSELERQEAIAKLARMRASAAEYLAERAARKAAGAAADARARVDAPSPHAAGPVVVRPPERGLAASPLILSVPPRQ
jgi:hypothetical protein